jgi:hypothetical protein
MFAATSFHQSSQIRLSSHMEMINPNLVTGQSKRTSPRTTAAAVAAAATTVTLNAPNARATDTIGGSVPTVSREKAKELKEKEKEK